MCLVLLGATGFYWVLLGATGCYWVLLGGAFWRLHSGDAGTEMWMNLLAANRNVHTMACPCIPLYALVGPCMLLWHPLYQEGQVGSRSES